jgi:hypothetical protein
MNNFILNKFINRLPLDIVLEIIPYTYHLQNKNLLDDIINYNETKILLFELYHKYWIIERQSLDPEEDKNWLINDIFAYANDYNATMYGYVDKFYHIFKRHLCLQTNEKIYKYVYNLEKKEVIPQINIFLGLLTIKERNDIITTFAITNEN